MKVRFAVSPGVESWDDLVLPDFVDALESLGFDTIWLSDIPMGPQVDPLVGLAFATGRTQRLKLGANLVPLGRNPMLVAKGARPTRPVEWRTGAAQPRAGSRPGR